MFPEIHPEGARATTSWLQFWGGTEICHAREDEQCAGGLLQWLASDAQPIAWPRALADDRATSRASLSLSLSPVSPGRAARTAKGVQASHVFACPFAFCSGPLRNESRDQTRPAGRSVRPSIGPRACFPQKRAHRQIPMVYAELPFDRERKKAHCPTTVAGRGALLGCRSFAVHGMP